LNRTKTPRLSEVRPPLPDTLPHLPSLERSGSLDRAPLLDIAGAIVGPGWEEIADRALRWAVENGTGNARMVP
jgi:hypothetical protein